MHAVETAQRTAGMAKDTDVEKRGSDSNNNIKLNTGGIDSIHRTRHRKYTVPGDDRGRDADGLDTAVSSRQSSTLHQPATKLYVDPSRYGTPWSQRSYLYQFKPFRGMYYDVKGRLPFYISDWTEGFRPRNMYRVIAATIRMYFIKWVAATIQLYVQLF